MHIAHSEHWHRLRMNHLTCPVLTFSTTLEIPQMIKQCSHTSPHKNLAIRSLVRKSSCDEGYVLSLSNAGVNFLYVAAENNINCVNYCIYLKIKHVQISNITTEVYLKGNIKKDGYMLCTL